MRLQNPRLSELFKTPKRKTYSLVGITFVVVGVFVVFSLRPTFVRIAELNREIKDKQEFLDKLDTKLDTLTYLISQKQSVAQELTYFEEDFPTENESGFLVANLSAIAETYGIDLMSIEFEEKEIEDEELDIDYSENIGINNVDLLIEGGFSDIENFVDYLETFPRILDIRSINYSQVDLTKFEGRMTDFRPIQGRISLYVYDWEGSGEAEEETESNL